MTLLQQVALPTFAYSEAGTRFPPERIARTAAVGVAILLHMGVAALALLGPEPPSTTLPESFPLAMEVALVAFPAPSPPADPPPEPVPEPHPPVAIAEEPVLPAPPPPPPKRPQPRKVERPVVRPAPVATPASAEIQVAAFSPTPALSAPPGPPREAPLVPPDVKAAYLANPKPNYPLAARRRGMEGLVVLSVLVGADGNPLQVEIARGSGHDILDSAARESVRTWRFKPAHRGGLGVEARVEVPIRFALQGAGEG